jgi:ubiquitin carboxyl-terminal hydrolase 34
LNRAIASSEESSIHVLVNSLEAIMWLGLLDGGFWGSLVTNDDFARAIQSLLLNGRRSLRTMTVKKAREFITRECSVGSSGTHRIAKFFWSSVSQLITDATLLPEQCHDLFELSNFLLRDAYQGWRQDIDFSALATQFSTLLLEHTSSEHIDQVDPLDPVAKYLVGHLLLCLQADESIARSGSLPERLGPELFWRHLFPRQRTAFEQPVANIILNSDTRSQLCSVIFILAKHDRAKFTQLLNDLTDLVPVFTTEDDDPYLYELPSSFDRFKALRAPCGYVGLRNLSNTCYLNSLLTQLYMNAPFRNFLLSSKVQDSDSSQQLLFQTQKLFGFMQESYRRFVDPSDVVASIRTYDDTPIDIHSQMDVDEFYNLLFDRWEGQLVNAAERRKLRSFFGGQLVQQVKSQECEHISERLEPFSAIQCDIKGKSSLEASLQAYVDGEILEGGKYTQHSR